MLSVLLQFTAPANDSGWLGDDGGAQGRRWDLLQDVDRLDGRLRGAGAHRRGHGVGHWLDGLR